MKILENINALTNIFFANKKSVCNFCLSTNFLLKLKKYNLLNVQISVFFNHLHLPLLTK